MSSADVAAGVARVPSGTMNALARWAGRASATQRRIAGVALALVTAVVLAGAVALVVIHHRNTGIAAAREDGLRAAGAGVAHVLSYDAKTIDQDAARAKDLLTGAFSNDFGTLLDQVIVPRARAGAVHTEATVTASSVVAAQPGVVTVLLFVNQQTTSNDSPVPVVSGSRVRATAVEQDGTWKLSELTPL